MIIIMATVIYIYFCMVDSSKSEVLSIVLIIMMVLQLIAINQKYDQKNTQIQKVGIISLIPLIMLVFNIIPTSASAYNIFFILWTIISSIFVILFTIDRWMIFLAIFPKKKEILKRIKDFFY